MDNVIDMVARAITDAKAMMGTNAPDYEIAREIVSQLGIYVFEHPKYSAVVLVDTKYDNALSRAIEEMTGGPQLLDDEMADLDVIVGSITDVHEI